VRARANNGTSRCSSSATTSTSRAVARALIASEFAAGTGRLRLGGAETIGNPRRARFVILGLAEGDAWLGALAAEVGERLAPIRYRPERYRDGFLPHLTLVRHRAATDLRSVCDGIGPEPVGPSWEVEEIVLFESELRAEGARHTVSARVRL
jgi:2'-5' RNA ligase